MKKCPPSLGCFTSYSPESEKKKFDVKQKTGFFMLNPMILVLISVHIPFKELKRNTRLQAFRGVSNPTSEFDTKQNDPIVKSQ